MSVEDNTRGMRVIGDGGDIAGRLEILEDHVHKPSKVYPTLAAGVTVTAENAGTNWTLVAFAEIVPASTITEPFDIHHLGIEALSANTVYEIVLYYGATDIECGRVRVTKNANLDATLNVPIQTPVLPANSRVRAKVATPGDNGETVDLSVFYHVY